MRTRHVLVVDDVSFNREFEIKLLKSIAKEYALSIEIQEASSVEEALKKLEHSKHYALILTDMNLPDGTGTDIAKVVYNQNSDTMIVALTIYPREYESEQKYFDLFFKKPINITLFKEMISKYLA